MAGTSRFCRIDSCDGSGGMPLMWPPLCWPYLPKMAPYVSWYHKLSLLPRDPVHLDFQLTRITYVITLYNVILRIARNYLETKAKFQPIHSTVQIWTDYNENEAKKIF